MKEVKAIQNPWKTKSIKSIYNNPWINVEHHEVITPSGTEGVYGKIKLKNLAIGIIPLDKNMNTWLVGQYRYTLNEYSWEIPMGGGPHDIDPLESAKRELKEETGITARWWQKILKIHTSNCVTDEIGLAYLAQDLSFGKTDFDDTEDLQIWKLPFNDAVKMVMEGEITDSLSVIGILKLARTMNF